jgi:hypothetical protein
MMSNNREKFSRINREIFSAFIFLMTTFSDCNFRPETITTHSNQNYYI